MVRVQMLAAAAAAAQGSCSAESRLGCLLQVKAWLLWLRV
jgi:hypothetical protein